MAYATQECLSGGDVAALLLGFIISHKFVLSRGRVLFCKKAKILGRAQPQGLRSFAVHGKIWFGRSLLFTLFPFPFKIAFREEDAEQQKIHDKCRKHRQQDIENDIDLFFARKDNGIESIVTMQDNQNDAGNHEEK